MNQEPEDESLQFISVAGSSFGTRYLRCVVLNRGVTTAPQTPQCGGGAKGQGGHLPLGKRNFSTIGPMRCLGGAHIVFSIGNPEFEVMTLVLN